MATERRSAAASRPLLCLLTASALLADGALGAKLLARRGDDPAGGGVAVSSGTSPIRKVVTLIEEMKATVEKEATEDQANYDKYMCWCETNEKQKGESISDAESRIEELSAFIEESAAKASELKTTIGSLQNDIAEDKDALASAASLREKELGEFLESEADMKETEGLLKEAIAVLSKVQLLQKNGQAPSEVQSHAQQVLLQLRNKVQHRFPKFKSVMQKDLFDIFGSLDNFVHRNEAFLPKRDAASFEQLQRLLPWEKTEEQQGMEANPNDLKGAAAGAKSYNARSGGILGLLSQMRDEFIHDLSAAQKDDFRAEVSFQTLRAAKSEEIAVATEQLEASEAELADTLDKAAKAKRDRESTTAAMEADQNFLANMKTDCQTEDEQYNGRVKVRSEEIVALGETLKILSEDEARDLFGKTSFLQLSATNRKSAMAARSTQVENAMQKIAAVARKNKDYSLLSLAVNTRLDAFTEVKAAMDKMLAELAKQQKEEYSKWEFCKSEIDKTEDEIKVAENAKTDLDNKHLSLSNTLEELETDIEALKTEDAEMQVSLKQAGEERKAQNEFYQTSVSDQRATVNILNKALARLKQFYAPELIQQPGLAVAPKPAEPKDYAKSAGAGGVIQLLMKIIEEAEVGEQQLEMDEQKAQADYGDIVRSTTDTIEAHRDAVAEKSAHAATAKAELSETEESQLSNNMQLEGLNDLLKAHHIDCDWLMKYFDVRQKSRQEEMDSITDAKAVLAGADFGK